MLAERHAARAARRWDSPAPTAIVIANGSYVYGHIRDGCALTGRRTMEDAAPMTASRDIDPGTPPPATRGRGLRGQLVPIAVVALGGALGACGRYAVGLAWPTPSGHFPTSTLVVNVVGCALMGAFMVLVTTRWQTHPLLRPFFGTGVLGGFTTFSTYEVEAHGLVQSGHLVTALIYLVGTLVAALAAVSVGAALTRAVALRTWEGDVR